MKELTPQELRLLAKQLKSQAYLMLMGMIGAVIIMTAYIFYPEPLPEVEAPDWDKPWDPVFAKVDHTAGVFTDEMDFGRQLILNTADFIGPNSDRPFAGNNLNCGSCHLDGGTKPFSAPYVGIPQQFPQYRGRENKEGTLVERINGCMQRSMNGVPLPEDAPEMSAMIAYMEWLSKDAQTGEKLVGQKFITFNYPNRKVDLEHGAAVFEQHCVVCHGADGAGVKKPNSHGYTYPPLWGPDSYNNGAGMHRVLTAAPFIKANMPLGVTVEAPTLTDEEAYDVAGYINSFDRPVKPSLEADFPDRTRKPMSTPYGPWADSFTPEQHKYGPYDAIARYYQAVYRIKKTK